MTGFYTYLEPTPTSQAATLEPQRVIYGGGQFVIVGATTDNAAGVETSPDGVNWTTPNLSGPALTSVAFASTASFGNEYLAMSYNPVSNGVGTFEGSANLVSWWQFALSTAFNSDPDAITSGNGLFLIWGGAGYTDATTGAFIGNLALSNNGNNWAVQNVNDITAGDQLNPAQFTTGTYGNGRFVLTDVRNNLYTASY